MAGTPDRGDRVSFPRLRLRRFRRGETWRRAVRETSLTVDDLVYPLFVVEGEDVRNPVDSMPGVFQLSVDLIVEEAREADSLGIPAVILFGVPDESEKDAEGSAGYDPDGLVPTAIRAIKEAVPDLLVWADVCLCEYTDHGHCGLLTEEGEVDGDATLPLLARAALAFAEAGADVTAVDRFEEFLNLVQSEAGVAGNLVVDRGLVRGLAYYNGLVFEVTHPRCATPLAGGGRYDDLAQALGSPRPLPALGFAYTLESLLSVAEGSGNGISDEASGALVMAEGSESYRAALQAAADLRQQGIKTELDVCDRDLSQGLDYARKMGMDQVVVVNRDGHRTAHAARQDPR